MIPPDVSDDAAARMSPPRSPPTGRTTQGQSPVYWPSWLVAGIALISFAIQLLWLPRTAEIHVSDLIAETLISLIPLVGLFLVQHLRPTPGVYWPMMVGFSFLLFSYLTDAIDEIRIQPAILGILMENGLAVLGSALLIYGLVRWLRFNRQLLEEIHALNADLEQGVAARTATLQSEIAERQKVEVRLRESEGRYRELNALLEQRVGERTAEVQAANALLREREESLQFILQGSRLGAWDWHIDSGKVERNDQWAAMLGYSRQEVDDATANGWLELIHPDDRARAWQSIEDHLAGRAALHEAEYRMRTRDGDYRWILDRARIVHRDADGRPLRMSGTHEDITERKQAQKALEQGHQRLTTILNAMDASVYIADMDTYELLFMNYPLTQAFGPVEGQRCYQVLQGLDAPCAFCTNDKLVKADGSPAGIYAWEFQNQQNHRWYDLRDCALRWTDGRLVRMEIATDVTERKQIDLQLRQSEERFRLLTTHALDNIWTMGPDYRLRYISPSIKALTDFTPAEYMDLPLERQLMPGSLAVAAAYFAALDERQAAGLDIAEYLFRGEIELMAKDGSGVWTEIIVAPLVDADGQLTELAGVTRDIRERKRYEDAIRHSEQRFRQLLDNLSQIAVQGFTPEGTITFWNQANESFYGYTAAEALGQDVVELIFPLEHRAAFRELIHQMASTGVLPPPSEYAVIRKDGTPMSVYANYAITDIPDIGRELYCIDIDLTGLRQIEEQLRISEERHRLLADHAIDVIWTMDLDGTFTYLSPSIIGLRGYTADELKRMPLEATFTPASWAIVQAGLTTARAKVQAGLPVDFRAELEELRKDGSIVWTDVRATGIYGRDGRFIELLGVTRDISERKRYEAELNQAREAAETANRALQGANTELQHLATTDRLTGIWNRLYFDEAVDAEIERANRYGEPLSLLLFDIDHFKAINDTHGHLLGDQVLIELTRRVRQHLRSGDVLARWGGEEFVALLPHTRAEDALHLAEKLRGLIAEEPFPAVGQVTSSFGVAQFQPSETIDLLLTRVDDALYAAKDGGRNQVRLAPPG